MLWYAMVCYASQVADDILTIAELEHCVLRAGMSAPHGFISKKVSTYT